jgi:hypothetical protein
LGGRFLLQHFQSRGRFSSRGAPAHGDGALNLSQKGVFHTK